MQAESNCRCGFHRLASDPRHARHLTLRCYHSLLVSLHSRGNSTACAPARLKLNHLLLTLSHHQFCFVDLQLANPHEITREARLPAQNIDVYAERWECRLTSSSHKQQCHFSGSLWRWNCTPGPFYLEANVMTSDRPGVGGCCANNGFGSFFKCCCCFSER